jgi:hypothetical protein
VALSQPAKTSAGTGAALQGIVYFHPRFQTYRLKKLSRFWKEALIKDDPETTAWYRSFFGRPFVDDRWYLSLFPRGRITGEVAEAYCSLERDRVARIHHLMPEVKIIFALRNPIERAVASEAGPGGSQEPSDRGCPGGRAGRAYQ